MKLLQCIRRLSAAKGMVLCPVLFACQHVKAWLVSGLILHQKVSKQSSCLVCHALM